jgi:hypothetical protein
MERAAIALTLAIVLLLSGNANASHSFHSSHFRCKEHDIGFGVLEGFATSFKPSGLAIDGDDTPRRLVGLPAPAANQLLVGGGIGIQLRCDYLAWDVLSLRLSSSFDSAGSGTAYASGAPVDIGLGAFHLAEIGLPFFGVPNGFQVFPERDWKVSFKLDWGMAHAWSSASMNGAFGGATGAVDDWDFYFRAQLAGCRAVGHVGPAADWLCLTASPIIYEKGWFPGASLGVRIDL